MTDANTLFDGDGFGALAAPDAPVFEELVQMTLNTFERSGLDPEEYVLARIAALVALDAAPASYLLNIGAADMAGVPLERVQGTLVAIAPVVGSARVVSAAGKIIEAFGEEPPGTSGTPGAPGAR